jgi:hypothetical protein
MLVRRSFRIAKEPDGKQKASASSPLNILSWPGAARTCAEIYPDRFSAYWLRAEIGQPVPLIAAVVKDYPTPALDIDPSRKLLLDGRCRIILNKSGMSNKNRQSNPWLPQACNKAFSTPPTGISAE